MGRRPFIGRGVAPRLGVAAAVAAASLLLSTMTPVAAYAPPGRIERLSESAAGGQTNGASLAPAISADGRFVAFVSDATNLIDNDTNSFAPDVFVRDRVTGAVDIVSVDSDGRQGNLGGEHPAISADGRFVAFTSSSRIAPGATGVNNVYVHDRITRTTELITVVTNPEGKSSFGASAPSISADGRFVAFSTSRTDLVSGIPPSAMQPSHVYVRDRVEGTTQLVSLGHDGTLGDGFSFFGVLSADGRFVAFHSFDDNLVPGDTNDVVDVFVHDRAQQTTKRVSIADDGSQADGHASSIGEDPPAISSDGRFVAFTSMASNLVPHDSNASNDVFVHDRQAGTTERVSITEDGAEFAGASHSPVMTSDGRFIGVVIDGSETAGDPQVFVRDRLLDSTELISRTDQGEPANMSSESMSLSGDGTLAVFSSAGTNLVPKDTNGSADVFLLGRGPDLGVVDVRAIRSEQGTSVSGSARFAGFIAARSDDPADDGGTGAVEAGAELTRATVAFRPEHEDTLLRVDLASLPSQPGGAGAGLPGIIYTLAATVDNTRYEVRASPVGTGGVPDFSLHRCVVVCERTATLEGGLGTAGSRVVVSVPHEILPVCCDKTLSQLRVSSALVDGERAEAHVDEIELPDATLGAARVDVATVPSGTSPDDAQFVTADSLEEGRFASSSATPTSLDPGSFDVLARACLGTECSPVATAAVETPQPEPTPTPTPTPTPDGTPEPEPSPVPRDRTSRLSVTANGDQTDKFSAWPAFSADGRYVAFFSQATNLVPNGQAGQYVADRIAGTVEFIAPGFTQEVPDISGDGRYVAFENGKALVEDDTNFWSDIYVHDRNTGGIERVSVTSDGAEANHASSMASISADGRYVVFDSVASNLVEGDTNGDDELFKGQDVFIHDRDAGTTERISISPSGEQANDHSFAPRISADGTTVVFISAASNLVDVDTNQGYDVFARDRATGATELVSVASDGTQGEATPSPDTPPAVSADGRYVAFASAGGSLVPRDHNLTADVFVRDRASGTTERVSVTSAGTEADFASSFRPELSADGRHVVFDSGADLMAEGESDLFDFNTYAYDRLTGLIERTSVTNAGEEGVESAFRPTTNADGRYVAFEARAALVSDDTNGVGDIYLRDRGPEVGIGSLTAEVVGDVIEASGWASFSGVAIAESDDEDDVTPGIAPAGTDVRRALIAYRPEVGDLLFRIDVSQMPSVPFLVAGSPGVVYGWGFSIDDVDYELRATNGHWLTEPVFELYRCDGTPCTRVTDLAGGYGSAGHDVRIALPLGDIDADEGTRLTNVRGFASAGDTATGSIVVADTIELDDALIPERTVAAGVAPAGTDRGDVAFEVPVERAGDGTFSVVLDPSELQSGLYDVWLEACIGEQCGADRAQVNIGPRAIATRIAFTETSALRGQYSDDALVEARLTTADGIAIPGAEVSFELRGAGGSATTPVVTDQDGLGSALIPLTLAPGDYELSATYAGDEDTYQPAAATVAFVVEREDTSLTLAVEGKGKNRTLVARLVDLDPFVNGISERVIRFYADGELLGQSTTGDDGDATLKAPSRYRGGKHDFHAVFEGDDFFKDSSAESTTKGGADTAGGSEVAF